MRVVITDKFYSHFLESSLDARKRFVVIKSPGNPRTQSAASWPRQLLPLAGLVGRVLTVFLSLQ